MNNEKRQFENCLVLLMGFPGTGKLLSRLDYYATNKN
jgi:hypothetical protein